VSVRRARHAVPLHWLGGVEAIADGAEGFDFDGGVGGLEAVAEAGDVDVDGAGVAVEALAPDVVEEVVAGEDDAGVGGEGGEEVELFGAEGDLCTGDEEAAGVEVEVEVAEVDLAGGMGRWSDGARDAAEDGADADDEFLGVEGFGQVIVGAEFETFDFVAVVVEGGEHDDGDVGGGTEAAADAAAVETGEHEVEDDEVDGGGVCFEGVEGGGAVVDDPDVVSIAAEIELDEFGDGAVVFDDEDSGHGVPRIGGASRTF
jgi:hypothetical protein